MALSTPTVRRLSGIEITLLAVIVMFGAGLRLLWIDAPLLDAHRWRQVDTAGIARAFYEDRFDLLHPQVNWGGAHPTDFQNGRSYCTRSATLNAPKSSPYPTSCSGSNSTTFSAG